MNYLAHAYLSFNQPEILVGNMISDFIKGKKQFDYSVAVQKGIQLHRAIDTFTDAHEATKKLKSFFQSQYRLYAGAFADVVYDYFLGNDKDQFASEQDLKNFSADTYDILQNNFQLLPDRFQKMFPYMKEHDWLYHYHYKQGIEKSFGGLVRRAAYLTESAIAFNIFTENIDQMQLCYNEFFPAVKNYAALKLESLLKS